MSERITKKFAAVLRSLNGREAIALPADPVEGLARLIETFQKVADELKRMRSRQMSSKTCKRTACYSPSSRLKFVQVAIAIQSPADTKIKGCWKCDHTWTSPRSACPSYGYAIGLTAMAMLWQSGGRHRERSIVMDESGKVFPTPFSTGSMLIDS